MGDGLNQRARYLLMLHQQLGGQIAPVGAAPSPLVSCNPSTGTYNLPAHGLTANTPVRFFIGASGGTVPTSAPVDTVFFALIVDANNFQISATSGGAAITSMAGGLSGETYVVSVTDPGLFMRAAGAAPAGKLSAVLTAYAQLGASNAWTASQTFTNVAASGFLSVAGTVIAYGTLAPQSATAPRSKPITATATTFMIDASAPVWICDTPFPGSATSATMTITIDATTVVPTTDQEVEVICFNLNAENATVVIQRNVPTTVNLAEFVYPDLVASARFKFSGGKWRQIGQPTGVHSLAISS